MHINSDEEIFKKFPRNKIVTGPNGEKGVVSHLDRSEITGALRVMVKWEATGFISQTLPQQLKV